MTPPRTSQFAAPVRPAPQRGNPHEALRHHVVTAVLVSHDGARWLGSVLEALLSQRRPVQRVVAVDTGSRDTSVDLLETALGPDQVLHRKRSTGYGAAVAFGLKSSAPVAYDEFGYESGLTPVEWIWLLHDDSAPAPDALGQLLLTAEDFPDAVVIGPKIRGWYDRRQLLEVGATVAANGRRWTGLERNEHDQGQHDESRPVLSVSSAGMLVRRDVWDRLRGFDRSISLFRDDLDFCWRVNNAGHKVVVAPDAVVFHAEAAARERRRVSAGANRPHLLDRGHALYAVAVNRATRFWPFLYFRLVLGSLLRAIGFVFAKSPGTAADELFAVAGFAMRPDRILRGRSSRRKIRAAEPQDLQEFFPPRGALIRNAFDTFWTQLRGDPGAFEQESTSRHRTVESGPVSEESEALETDSAALIKRLLRTPIVAVGLGLTVIALIAARSLLFGGVLAGGALLPAPGGASDLWNEYLAGWHPVGLGSTAAAPPYVALVAILATILAGKADLAVAVLLIGSVPLAGLSASRALRRVTPSPSLRIWGGYAYGLMSVATGAIASGRLGTAVAVAVLPLVVTTATEAIGSPTRPGSTRSAWTCAFLLSVAAAFDPVIWLLALGFAALSVLTVVWRARSNVFATVIRMVIVLGMPMAVLMPWSFTLLKHPAYFLVEPGLTGAGLDTPAPTPIGLLLGDPGGPGTYPAWIAVGLLLAALAALLRGTRRRIVVSAWALAIVGFGSAVAISHVQITPPGAGHTTPLWPGVSAAMLGLGLITATIVGAEGVRERIASAAFGWRQPLTVLVVVVAALAPVGAGAWWLFQGAQGPVARIPAQILPLYVAAEGQTAGSPRTLILTGGADGSIDYNLVRGTGPTLGDADIPVPAAETSELNQVVSNLLAGSAVNAIAGLGALDIEYVLVGSTVPAGVTQTLDGLPGLIEHSVMQGGSQQYGVWSIDLSTANVALGRIYLTDSAQNNMLPITYQCGGSVPAGTARACSQQVGATVVVPPGPAGRVLILSEQASSGWSATIGGQKLTAANVGGPDDLQGWQVPSGGGTVTIGYHSYAHTGLLIGEGVAALIAMIMALPFGRRADEPDEDELIEAGLEEPKPETPDEPDGPAGGPGGPGGAAGELGFEPEPERRPEPEPERIGSGEYPQAVPEWAGQAEPAVAASAETGAQRYTNAELGYEPEGYEEQQRYPAAAEAEGYQSGSYEAQQYPAEQYQTGQYQTAQYQESEYAAPGYESGQYETGRYEAGQQYEAGPAESGQYYPEQQQYGAGQQYGSEQQQQYSPEPQYGAEYAADPAAAGGSGAYESAPQYAAQQPEPAAEYGQDAYTAPGYPADQYAATGQYSTDQYPSGQYSTEQYAADQYAPDQYSAPQQSAPQYGGADPYASGQYPATPYAGAQNEADQYPQDPYSAGTYLDNPYDPAAGQAPAGYPEAAAPGYAVPEQRQPDESGQHPAEYGYDYQYEYDRNGTGHREQDGWDR
jgi:GT2 family glycosyltransferase